MRFLPDGPTALFVVKTMPVRAHRRRLCPLRQHSLDRNGRRSRNCRDRTFGALPPDLATVHEADPTPPLSLVNPVATEPPMRETG